MRFFTLLSFPRRRESILQILGYVSSLIHNNFFWNMDSRLRWNDKLIIGFIITFIISLSTPAFALNIEDKLDNPVQEQRAQNLFQDIRCMVCAGESISDSRADLAKDLRSVVRERIKYGHTDKQILDFVATRYGDNILMQPPLKPATYLLWFGPLLILLAGVVVMLVVIHRNKVKNKY